METSQADDPRPLVQGLFVGALLLLGLIIFHGPLVWLGQVLCGRDLPDYFIPLRDAQLRQGWLAPWFPSTFSGLPLGQDPQLGLLYPPNWLHLAGLAPERAVTSLAMLHMLLGGVGMGLLAAGRVRREAALMAAILWVFGGYQMLRLTTGVVTFTYALAWVPWMWWAAERQALRRGGNGKAGLSPLAWVGLLGLFGGMQLLAGAPQIVQITWVGLAAWTGGRLVWPGPGEARGAIPGGFVAAAAGALLIAAPMLAGTLSLLGAAAERGADQTWAYLSDGSLHPRVLLTWFFPELFASGNAEDLYWGSGVGFAETNAYLGIAPWILGAAGLGFWLAGGRTPSPGEEAAEGRRWPVMLLVLPVLALLVALGSHGFLFRPLTMFVPTFDFFRVPARWVLWLVGPVCLLAALGLEALLDRAETGSEADRRAALKPWLAVGLLAVIAFALARALAMPLLGALGVEDILGRIPPQATELRERVLGAAAGSLEWALLMAVLTVALGAVALLGKLQPRVVLVLLLLLVVLDLRRFWSPFTEPVPADIPSVQLPSEAPFHRIDADAFRPFFFPETELVRFARDRAAESRIHYNDTLLSWRFDEYQREFLHERPASLGIEITRGYQQLHLAPYVEDYYASLSLPDGMTPGAFLTQLGATDRRFLDAYNVGWFLTHQADQLAPELEALGLERSRAFPPAGLTAFQNPGARGWAWVSGVAERLDAEPDPAAGAATVVVRKAGDWSGTASIAIAPGWLHLALPDAPGWRLEATGPNGAVAAESGVASIKLPAAGEWRWTLQYRNPALGAWPLLLAGLGLLGMIGVTVAGVMGGRRRAGKAPAADT